MDLIADLALPHQALYDVWHIPINIPEPALHQPLLYDILITLMAIVAITQWASGPRGRLCK